MGSGKRAGSSARNMDSSIGGLHESHQRELENLTLIAQPFKTLKYFVLAVVDYIRKLVHYLSSKGGWLLLLSAAVAITVFLLVTVDGPHEKHLEELSHYLHFGLWWTALGVASSIGLGSGLHTFVLYLGPHIAFFTIKAMQCGRVDLKSAPYDTIQLKRGPSWLDKSCREFGEPVFPLSHSLRVPLGSILPQIQLEAVLWGLGTALGELPPYFISRAARLSGGKLDAMEEFDTSSDEDGGDGFISRRLTTTKRWLLSQSQHLNFFSILLLASVPNPLFDLAGIMCGQLGIAFWEFFLATLLGKAIIKTHIQTIFIISVCNNQLLNWMENELIWMFSFIPGLASVLPSLITKLHALREKYMSPEVPVAAATEVKKWDLSFSAVWNTVVSLMLLNFFFKIVNATAQSYRKNELEKELAATASSPIDSTHLD